jgi:ubiquinone/menaquinone biosynthesis C-methylase UbiE
MKTAPFITTLSLLSSPVQSFAHQSRRAFLATASSSTMTSSTTTTTHEGSGQTGKLWDRFAEGYSKKPIDNEEAYQKKLQVTQQYLRKDMNVLEFGCGTGSTSIIHAPYVHKIVATDISGKMIEIAKQKAHDANIENVEFQQKSMDQLDLPDESQDVVLGLSILHLLKNRDDAIAKTRQLLKPGGLFVSSTPCLGDNGAPVTFLMSTFLSIGNYFGLLPYVNIFTRSDLKQSLTNHGFSIEHEWQPAPKEAVFIIGKKL